MIAAFLFLVAAGITGIFGWYTYNKEIGSYWSLADKSSSIDKKSEYIDKFVGALELSGLSGKYNAVFLTTPDNSFDYNLDALKTLQARLHEISNMDVTSFEYQTAIQQITAQEQGEAEAMLSVFYGVWWKKNHPLLWNWICGVHIGLLLFVLIASIVFLINEL